MLGTDKNISQDNSYAAGLALNFKTPIIKVPKHHHEESCCNDLI